MSTLRNRSQAPRPLSPRSVIASLLLGMHPPRIRGGLLVRWCEHLGIAEGTTRVALFRMVETGELTVVDGRYELAGALRDRQTGQDWALAPVVLPWRGDWVLWIVQPGRRDAVSRAALRGAARSARLVELRDGVWTRPHNLPPEATAAGAARELAAQTGPWIATPAAGEVPDVDRLFDLPATEVRARQLLEDLDALTAALRAGDLSLLGPAFTSGAAALQQIRRDPLLPTELAGDDWTGEALRSAYARYRAAFADAVTAWFAAADPDRGA